MKAVVKKTRDAALARSLRAAGASKQQPARKAPTAPVKRSVLTKPSAVQRDTYRHGDLRRALLEAGIDLARDGGPDAVVLREATRRVGVVPNAAYRHFENRDDLLQAVGDVGFAGLATAMEDELARVSEQSNLAERASQQFKAVGRGYMRYALAEPGLFRTGFATAAPHKAPRPERAGPNGLNAFQLLCAALDGMAQAGVLSAPRRQGAEFVAWAAVHGLAMLQLEGPLRGLDKASSDALAERLLEMVDKGIR